MEMMKSLALRRAGYVVLLVGIGAVLWFSREGLLAVWRDHHWAFLVLAVLMMVGMLVQVLNFLHLLEWHERLAVRAAAHAWALATLLNYLAPFQPGLALRLAYFKSQGVPLSRTAATTLRQLHLSMWTALLVAGVAFCIKGGHSGWVAGLLLMVAFIAWPMVLAWSLPWLKAWRWPAWMETHRGSVEIAMTPLPLRKTFYFFVQHALGATLVLFAYREFGAALSPANAMLISVGVYLSSLVAILPNNLGLLEGLYILTARASGLDPITSLALALFIRGAHICACLAMALVTWRTEGIRR